MRSGSRAPDAKIRTGLGAGMITVDSWDPADGTDDLDHNHSFKVNLHPDSNTIEKEVLFDGGGTFEAGGTLTDLNEIGEGVELASSSPSTDFEDYIADVGLNSASQPETWLYTGGWSFFVRDGAANWDGKHVNCVTGNGYSSIAYTEGGTMLSGEVSMDWYWDSAYEYVWGGPMMNVSGSGTAMRGHAIWLIGTTIYLKRINSSTSATTIKVVSHGMPVYEDTVYKIKVKFEDNGVDAIVFHFKVWDAANAEPASWTYLWYDTIYRTDGWVGIWQTSGSGNGMGRYDNFSMSPSPATYLPSGDWVSDEIDMTSIVNYSHALLDWDETTPVDTTAAVKARWRADGSWLACTNGGQVPGIDLGEDMTAGSSKDSLELKIELATTDTGETPLVENLRFYHEPIANSALLIDIHSETECTEADGTLDIWGKRQIIGGVNDIAWDDVWCETFQPRHQFGLDFSLLVKLIYNEVTIDEIIVSTARDFWAESSPMTGYQWSMLPLIVESAAVEARWVVSGMWASMGHTYAWVLADLNLGIHADAWYIIGHPTRNDHPGYLIAAIAELDDHPGFLLAKGYALDQHPGEFLVQGWRQNNEIGMVMPATQDIIDHVGHILPAVAEIADHPGMHLVYGVNRDGSIFVNVVDDDTYAKLIAEGIVFS